MFEPSGGNIPGFMITLSDHDGSNEEGAPGYISIWGGEITKIAMLMDKYPAYTRHNIFREFPHAAPLFLTNYRLGVLGRATPNIGDAGSTGAVKVMNLNPQFMAQ